MTGSRIYDLWEEFELQQTSTGGGLVVLIISPGADQVLCKASWKIMV